MTDSSSPMKNAINQANKAFELAKKEEEKDKSLEKTASKDAASKALKLINSKYEILTSERTYISGLNHLMAIKKNKEFKSLC